MFRTEPWDVGFRLEVVFTVSALRFRTWGFGLGTSASGFLPWDFGFRLEGLGISGLGFRLGDLGFRLWDFGFRVSVLGFRTSGFGLEIFGFRVSVFSVFGFGVSDFGFREEPWDVGFRLEGVFRVSALGYRT